MTANDLAVLAFCASVTIAYNVGRYTGRPRVAQVRHSLNRGWR